MRTGGLVHTLGADELPPKTPPGSGAGALVNPKSTAAAGMAEGRIGLDQGYAETFVAGPLKGRWKPGAVAAEPGEPRRAGKLVLEGIQPGAVVESSAAAQSQGEMMTFEVDHSRALVGSKGRQDAEWVSTAELRMRHTELPVHDVRGPFPTIGGPNHPVLCHSGGLILTGGVIRRPLGVELWKAQGGETQAWER